ncbi:acyltransferase family protein [Oryzicola mucosus]|uniref:Acyltransferase n=1 Tax=Oryzicola mucosus TaxID=2767425 RepID=A0A8J6Q4Z5_9HYPH|nr:acyltransferase family protein [Oryzicola mucosus]MBD0416495.1 acyltransferase [Oryzicola mucosus]
MSANTYRPEVDGLRTISVMAVLLYHYGLGPFPGGFVGVDVFFVISGYLITSILFADMQKGRFSVLGFYDRRARRILPASLVTILATGVAGYFTLLPRDYAAFGWSAIASAFGLANFHFLADSGGYFDSAADLMPLLHMWSLGVEEQFYVIWPLVLWAVFALSKGSAKAAVATLAVIVAVSFAASVAITKSDQQVAFYMLHTRAWELALGAVLAFAPTIRNRTLGEAMPVAGLALIVYAIFFLSSKMPFPGWNALYPCIGAALIIWPKTAAPLAEWPLRTRPFTFIGLISFSLYLWHWPVLVLYRQIGIGEMPPLLDRVLLACLAFTLAVLTYRFIETPFRNWRPAHRISVSFGAASMAAVAAIAFGLVFFGGLPQRLPAEARSFEQFRNHKVSDTVDQSCFIIARTAHDYDAKKCILQDDGRTRVLVLGDSHAAHFVSSLRRNFPETAFSVATTSGCKPFAGGYNDDRCGRMRKMVFEDILPREHFDAVIISARWGKLKSERITKTIKALKKRADRVIVFGSSLEYGHELPLLLAKSAITGRKELLEFHNLELIRKREQNLLKSLEGAEFVSMISEQCKEACTALTRDGAPMMFDGTHFTEEGADMIVRGLKEAGKLKF